MYYPDELVEEVRSRSDIVEVISGYVRLQKRGSTYFGLCPFHNEKTPSFSVTPHKQMYYCFGCGAGGNVFTFLMNYENISFAEAMKTLAEKAGVTLPEREMTGEEKKARDLRNTLLELHKEAGRYYYYLLKSEQGKMAMDYLTNRGLSPDIIRRFGLGYAGMYRDGLYRFLKSRGYADEVIRESGLCRLEEKGVYDKFWNRVMFPIMDVNNRIIGFGGRVMGKGEPKYLNSPETKLFDKSRNLYGLNYAKASKRDYVICCEGYMDVISMHQAGFNNAVASLGTALTERQAALLKRYTSQVILAYDSDGAGVKAALRAIPIMRGAGMSVRVLDLRPHKDPDEFIKALGVEEFEKRLSQAENFFLFQARILSRNYDMEDPEQKTAFYREIAKMLLAFPDELERNNYLEAVCDHHAIPKDSMKKLVISVSRQVGLMSRREDSRQPGYMRRGEDGRQTGRAGRGEDGRQTGYAGRGEDGRQTGNAGRGEDGRQTGYAGRGEDGRQTGNAGQGEDGRQTGYAGPGEDSWQSGYSPGEENGQQMSFTGYGPNGEPLYAPETQPVRNQGGRAKKGKDEGIITSQRILLTWLVNEPRLFGRLKGILSPQDFTGKLYREVAEHVFAQLEKGKVEPAQILDHFINDDEEYREVAQLFHTQLSGTLTQEETDKALTDTVRRVKKNSLEEKGRSVKDFQELQEILKEQKALDHLSITLE